MAVRWSNNASTTVAGAISATDTTVALAPNTGQLFPQVKAGSGDYFVATFYDQQTKTIYEIVHVTDITGDVATIVRGNVAFGHDYVSPKPWSAGDIFANLITAGTLDNFVQAGTGPADTSLVYVGTDTSTDPAHIIAVTNPVPANYAVGMLFNIKVGGSWSAGFGTNYGPVDCTFNGKPAVIAKRTDGSDMGRADFTKNLEYIFVYNGVTFSTTIMNAPKKPPQYIFYVRADSTSVIDANGIESHTGFANTPQDAFKSIQGAINTIEATYISTQSIKIMVADGYYTSGFIHSTQYVTAFEVQGNDANPQNVTIDCTSVNMGSYVPGSPGGSCAVSGNFGNLTVHGFTFKSYADQVVASVGYLNLYNCNISSPTSGHSAMVISVRSGSLGVTGNIHISTPTPCQGVFVVDDSGVMGIGGRSDFTQTVLNLYLDGTVTGVCFMEANKGGVISVANDTGPAGNTINLLGNWPFHGYEYAIGTGAGVGYLVGTSYFPSSQLGYVLAPGWVT